MKKSLASRVLTLVLYVILVCGIVLVITLPFMLNYYLLLFHDSYAVEQGYRMFITAFLMLSGALGVWILLELLRLVRTMQNDPFLLQNVKSLARMGIVAMIMTALFFAKCCYYFTILTFGCGIILMICSLAAFTLADLFRQAIKYKDENDLTI